MASLQDRLQMNRNLLDNWSTREQLCLAGAVSCSGDQNWVSVSRNLKIVCNNNNRPADWFSQKSCALQYANLLENVETPKRKKRSSEGNSRVSSPPTIVETPTDSVLRRLTEERIQELKTEIRKDQEEYAKIHAELQKIQSPHLTEEALQEMWREIEQEQEAQRISEMKLENQLREREQRRQDLQRNWRLGVTGTSATSKQENTAVVDMDVEEIIGVSKPIVPAQQQTATSPLLSSLLKSPTATAPPNMSNVASSARTTAPTITTLLTSGSIPNTNQPAIILNSDLIPPEKAVQLLSRPISGPPVGDSLNLSNTVAQNLLSPSQSAPTLSMLLEKNKIVSTVGIGQQALTGTNAEVKNNSSGSKVVESNKEEEPMEIEDDGNVHSSKVENEANADSDEPDPNEEQQLMEVFKNIGNIELDIDVSAVIDDEEVDFLKGVDEESPGGTVESMEFENKLDEVGELASNTTQTRSELKDQEEVNKVPADNCRDEPKTVKTEIKCSVEQTIIKIETSSDDSNDNIPLAAVATLENKERSLLTPTTETEEKSNENNFLKAKVESAITFVEDSKQNQLDESATTSKIISPVKVELSEPIKEEHIYEHPQNDLETCANVVSKSDASEDIFEDTTDEVEQELTNQEKHIGEESAEMEPKRSATPTGDAKLDEKEHETTENILEADEDSKSNVPGTDNDNAVDNSTADTSLQSDEPTNSIISQIQDNANINESILTATLPPPPSSHISIADTDDDSCTTDISVITSTNKREDKPGTSSTSSTGTKQALERGVSQSRKAGSHDTLSKSTEDSDSSSGNRASKRSLLSILNNLASSKSAQTMQLALTDEQLKSKYQKTCYRILDFQIIKKSIENGTIRSVVELQRDLLQLAKNVNFLFHSSTANYKAAEIFKHEMQNVREFIFNAHEFEAKTEKEVKDIKQAAVKQGRTGSRKSLRIS